MNNDNLYKGFEVELFTGSQNNHVGVSDDIEKTFSNFVKEPDNRNVEYITNPEKDYKVSYENLLEPRINLREWLNKRDLTIIATGSEVEIALETSDLLLKDNIKASVVSLPCWEIFEKQSEEYKLYVLGEKLKVGVEAGSELGWHKYIGSNGIFIGMKTFGASAPANHLFEHFGLSSDKIREKILGKINT